MKLTAEQDFFDILFFARRNLKYLGWIIIPPECMTGNNVDIRVEWFIDGQRYGYQETFKPPFDYPNHEERFQRFIWNANRAIDELLEGGNYES